ncbi:MAG: thiol:disulfide interchange protein, partial [Prevotella sp.]|nr:thiol:disulfide interchange protein [Prevotella sp.]
MKKGILILLFILSFYSGKLLADDGSASWKISIADKGNGEIELVANASIAAGWHLYDTKIPDGGPYPTSISIDEVKGAIAVGTFHAVNSKLHKEFDKIFEMEIGYFEKTATFVQRFKVTDKSKFVLKGDIRAQTCNDKECTPPIPIDFSFTSGNLPSSVTVATEVKDVKDVKEVKEQQADVLSTDTTVVRTDSISQAQADSQNADLWTPVIDKMKPYGTEEASDKSLLWIFLGGFGGGLIALLTPCVWPMIPMTVSFFLKRNKKSRSKAIKDAVTYGVGIIIIYVALGLIITAIFGASALNDLATSAIFNILFFALLVVFAVSFFGA